MTRPIVHPNTTLLPPADDVATPEPPTLALTLVAHPSLRRIGDRVLLTDLAHGQPVALSRLGPAFCGSDGQPTGPIDEPYVSRSPLQIVPHANGGVTLVPPPKPTPPVTIDRAPLHAPIACGIERLHRGVVIGLSGRVLVLLHTHTPPQPPLPSYGLVGESAAIQQVRLEIKRAAALTRPTVIRGESGTGKELIARALHAASPRAARPYVALNMSALSPQIAMAELFGHTRGAFTGAVQEREGYFRQADGGTLFLDEIGEASVEVQMMLLRVLESGEIQPVGGRPGRRVDVWVLAATDTNLESAVLRGDFRISLLHRLAGCEIRVPPLRQRRDDIPRLLFHFIAQEERRIGRGIELGTSAHAEHWLPTRMMEELLHHEWPGNVRELGNIARRMLGALLVGQPVTSVAALVGGAQEPALAPPPPPPAPAEARGERTARAASELSDDALLEAMQAHDWQISATARTLGISRKSLYARIDQSGHLRKARDLAPEEITEALALHHGDVGKAASTLAVSVRALQLRMRELGHRWP